MPYIGILNNERVWPDEVDDGQDVHCPGCEEVMSPRKIEGKVRHFWHYDGVGGGSSNSNCAGGESETHKRMKYISKRRAKDIWPNASIDTEVEIGTGEYQADVVVEFNKPKQKSGCGVAIECQYKNDSKDIEATTDYYARHGFTTIWVEEEHFTDKNVELQDGEWCYPWPRCVPLLEEWSGLEHREISVYEEFFDEFEVGLETRIRLPPDYWVELQREFARKTIQSRIVSHAVAKHATAGKFHIRELRRSSDGFSKDVFEHWLDRYSEEGWLTRQPRPRLSPTYKIMPRVMRDLKEHFHELLKDTEQNKGGETNDPGENTVDDEGSRGLIWRQKVTIKKNGPNETELLEDNRD